MDFTKVEDEMLWEAVPIAGEYLTSLGVDVAALNQEQWITLMRGIVQRLHEVRLSYAQRIEDDLNDPLDDLL